MASPDIELFRFTSFFHSPARLDWRNNAKKPNCVTANPHNSGKAGNLKTAKPTAKAAIAITYRARLAEYIAARLSATRARHASHTVMPMVTTPPKPAAIAWLALPQAKNAPATATVNNA